MVDAEIQVNVDEINHDEDDVSSSGIDTASVTEKPNMEDCNLGSVENGESHERTFNHSFELRNFSTPQRTSTMESYVAMRLASPFLPSPILDRRTIL